MILPRRCMMQEYINHDLEAAMEKMEWKDD
jgi:hypothetical protein